MWCSYEDAYESDVECFRKKLIEFLLNTCCYSIQEDFSAIQSEIGYMSLKL